MSLPLVGASSYSLPGNTPIGSYNNIGILGEVMMDVNVTVVNTAPFPKFIVVNPRYSFRVYRGQNNEYLYTFREENGKFVHFLPSNIYKKNTLNYFVGFWLMPYEVAKINFILDENSSYVIDVMDYNAQCGEVGKISSLTYSNGTLSEGKIYSGEDIENMFCGVLYPQMINTPMFLSVDSMFPLLDGHVRILGYDGRVKFKLTNIPNEGGDFYVFFAFSIPIIFQKIILIEFSYI